MMADMCVYYDQMEAGYSDLRFLLIAFLALVFCALLLIFSRSHRRVMGGVGTAFMAVWIAIASYQSGGQLQKLRSAYETQSYKVVEGTIVKFRPSVDGKPDTFEVSGRYFSIFPFKGDMGFHQVSHQGSPLENGLYVRIWHYYDDIIRLEIEGPGKECER
jgi:hypothetical protein